MTARIDTTACCDAGSASSGGELAAYRIDLLNHHRQEFPLAITTGSAQVHRRFKQKSCRVKYLETDKAWATRPFDVHDG